MRLTLVICVLLAGCAAAPSTITGGINPGEEFRLPLGGDIGLNNTQYVIVFEEVLEDSRCARGTTCVWEGNARIKLILREFAAGYMGPNTVEVLDSYAELNTHPGQPQKERFADYVIELRGLEPYPSADTQNGSSPAYVATLIVNQWRTPQNTQGSQ